MGAENVYIYVSCRFFFKNKHDYKCDYSFNDIIHLNKESESQFDCFSLFLSVVLLCGL